jgi:hypothetical protein
MRGNVELSGFSHFLISEKFKNIFCFLNVSLLAGFVTARQQLNNMLLMDRVIMHTNVAAEEATQLEQFGFR